MSWSDNNADDEFTASGFEAEEEVEAEDTCRSSRARVFLVTTISFTFALTVVLVIISKTDSCAHLQKEKWSHCGSYPATLDNGASNQ